MNIADKILTTGTRTLSRPVAAGMGTIAGVTIWLDEPYLKMQDGSMVRVTASGTGSEYVDAKILQQLPPDLQVWDILEMTQDDQYWVKGDELRVVDIKDGFAQLTSIRGGTKMMPLTDPWFGQYTKWPDNHQRPFPEGHRGKVCVTDKGSFPVPIQWIEPTVTGELTQLLNELEEIKKRIQKIISITK